MVYPVIAGIWADTKIWVLSGAGFTSCSAYRSMPRHGRHYHATGHQYGCILPSRISLRLLRTTEGRSGHVSMRIFGKHMLVELFSSQRRSSYERRCQPALSKHSWDGSRTVHLLCYGRASFRCSGDQTISIQVGKNNINYILTLIAMRFGNAIRLSRGKARTPDW